MPDRSKTDDERDEAKRGGRKPRAGDQSKRPEWPKPFVRLTRQADGPGGFGCEVRLVGEAEGEGPAKEEGYAAIDPRAGVLADFVEFPKWQYHPDGRREIVYSQEAADALEGYEDTPPAGDEAEAKAVAAPVAQATAGSLRNRPPVPPDRG
jgi:hypothetical protein